MKLQILSFSIYGFLCHQVLGRPKYSGGYNNNDDDCEDEVNGLEPPSNDYQPMGFPAGLPSFDMPPMPAHDNFIPNKFSPSNDQNQNVGDPDDCEEDIGMGAEPPSNDYQPLGGAPSFDMPPVGRPSNDFQPAMPAHDELAIAPANNDDDCEGEYDDDQDDDDFGNFIPSKDMAPSWDMPAQVPAHDRIPSAPSHDRMPNFPPPPSHDRMPSFPSHDNQNNNVGDPDDCEEEIAGLEPPSNDFQPAFDNIPSFDMPSHDRQPNRPSNDFQPLPPLPSHDELAVAPASNDDDCEDEEDNSADTDQDIFDGSSENEDFDNNNNNNQNDDSDAGDFDSSFLENYIPSKWKAASPKSVNMVMNLRPKRMMISQNDEQNIGFVAEDVNLSEDDMDYLENPEKETSFQFTDDDQYYLDFYAERG